MPKSPERLEQRARNVLLYQLGRSMKTRKQLREVMIRREIPEEIFEPLLDRFEEAGLYSDSEFARAYVPSRVAAGKSVRLIQRELRERGVSDALIEQHTSEISFEDEQRKATELAQRRMRQLAKLDAQTRYRRLSGYLYRRGYSSQVVTLAVRAAEAQG
jgi:regulatory protein